MSFIQNVAAMDIGCKFHEIPKDKSMLIQIMDHDAKWWPTPMHEFTEIHQFEFTDDNTFSSTITDQQAKNIIDLLEHALKNDMDVVIHCLAGICRSGAVAKVGEFMGFQSTNMTRIPNKMVEEKLMNAYLTVDVS